MSKVAILFPVFFKFTFMAVVDIIFSSIVLQSSELNFAFEKHTGPLLKMNYYTE